jgi:HlyD family secretion protein
MRCLFFGLPILGCAAILAGCGEKALHRQDLPPQMVSVAQVALHDITGGLTASGRLSPREEIGVAADLSGYRIARVAVEEGASVQTGDVLAVLDDSLLRSQIDQLRASLLQQQIAAEQAQEQAARTVGLKGQGVLSDEAIRNRDLAERSAQATVAVTRAQLNDLLVRRDHMVIRAPTSGIVIERDARPGDTSAPGTTLFRLARDSLIELYAELPEADVAHVAPGDPAEVTLASGKSFAGKVRLIGERVDNQTGLVTVRIALPVSPDLRNGGFAKARFVRTASVLAVPEGAVRFDADGASVTVVGHDDRVHRAHVRTGQRSGGLVEIVQGPAAGTKVAVKGAAFVLDGDKVRIAGTAR